MIHSTAEFLHFINAYRNMEKQALQDTFRLIKSIFAGKHYADHLCDQWKWKKKSFGSFFLNLDWEARIIILEHFGIRELETPAFLTKYRSSPMAALFIEPPAALKELADLILFFENHGICEDVTPDIHLQKIPKQERCFGNATNWGDYVLSLDAIARRELLEKICDHYKAKSVTI